jgi:hypothetical protein
MQTGANDFGTEHDDYGPLVEDHKDAGRFFYVMPLLHPPAMAFTREVEIGFFPPHTPANELFRFYVINWPKKEFWGDQAVSCFNVFSVPIDRRGLVNALAENRGLRFTQAVLTKQFPMAALITMLNELLHQKHPEIFAKDFLLNSPVGKAMGDTMISVFFPVRGARVRVLDVGLPQEIRTVEGGGGHE